jgi:hypothetical protein
MKAALTVWLQDQVLCGMKAPMSHSSLSQMTQLPAHQMCSPSLCHQFCNLESISLVIDMGTQIFFVGCKFLCGGGGPLGATTLYITRHRNKLSHRACRRVQLLIE